MPHVRRACVRPLVSVRSCLVLWPFGPAPQLPSRVVVRCFEFVSLWVSLVCVWIRLCFGDFGVFWVGAFGRLLGCVVGFGRGDVCVSHCLCLVIVEISHFLCVF